MPPNSTKKKKRPPQRRCGDWCEFLSSKGKLYYFQIKKGYTQWSKPESWDDNQAYEPSVKRRNIDQEAVSNTNATPQETINPKNIETWSSSMTSLKAKIQLKSDLKKSQKKRRDRVLDQLKDIETTQKQELPAIHEMVSLTSQSSIGVDLRELIHDKTEKRANVLARDRLRRQAQIIETELIVAMSKSKYQEAEKLMDYTQLRINNIKTALEMTKDTIIKPL